MADGRIKSVLVCGFLGAGKTSFLTALLKSDVFAGRRVALLVNEFGTLPVDGAILPKGDYHLAEINRGSIFCACVKGDLIKAMDAIAREIKPEWLLIETTGLAEPSDFAALLLTDYLKNSFVESSTICVADALNFPKLSRGLPAISMQVRVADIILLNKCDLVDEAAQDAVEKALKELNPSAEIIRTRDGVLPISKPEELVRNAASPLDDAKLHLCKAPPENTDKLELRSIRPVPKEAFYKFLDSRRDRILRAKGVVDFGDSKRFIDVVNGGVSSRSAEGIDLGEGGTALCVILRNFSALEFRDEFSRIFK